MIHKICITIIAHHGKAKKWWYSKPFIFPNSDKVKDLFKIFRIPPLPLLVFFTTSRRGGKQ